MLTPRGKSPLTDFFPPEEDRSHDAASSRTACPTHYQPGAGFMKGLQDIGTTKPIGPIAMGR